MGAECPAYPLLPKQAKAELRKFCFPQTLDTHETIMNCPFLWGWLNQQDVLKKQLSQCGG